MSTAGTAVIVDHGIGNILSVARACDAVGATVERSDRPEKIARADRLILPGVGAFGDCMRAVEHRGLVEPIRQFARSGRPLLGICVGMQMLMSVGEEFGETPGLSLIPGRVRAIPRTGPDGTRHKIPHIGWNAIRPPRDAAPDRWKETPLSGTPEGGEFYFVHSFAAAPDERSDLVAVCEYNGLDVTASIGRDSILGVQFHPEKSGPAGLAIISQFFGL